MQGAPPTTASASAAHPQSFYEDQPPVEHSAPAVIATAADRDIHTTHTGRGEYLVAMQLLTVVFVEVITGDVVG